jgi:O-antigen/teichoic acid export membrane protein
MASQSRLDEPAASPAQRRAGPIARMFDRRRLLTQFLLLGNRAVITAAKFLLAVYTARYLGLADLGIYGLLVAGTTIVPAIAGFGMTDWIVRRIVDLPSAQAMPLMACRSSLTICVHLVVQPLLFLADVLLGEPIPLRLAVLGGLILMLDNLNSEASDMLVARRHILLANALTFLRAGLWPLLVIAVGLVFPQTRTLQALLIGWAVMLVVSSSVLAVLPMRRGRWRHMRPQWGLIVPQLSGSRALYVKDVSGTLGIFVDRFIISAFLGLELTGVYTFFWSITNVVHSLALVGMLLAQIASLLAAGRKADKTEFHAIERSLQIEIGAWTLLLSLGIAIATPLLLPYLGRPLLENYLFVFWIILFATILRIAADGYGYALLALNRDTEIAIIAFVGAIASAVLNAILTPLAGLWGAATAYVITAAGLLAIRYYLTRPQVYGRILNS